MVSGLKGEAIKSKTKCAKCDKRVMENLMMCTKCGKWVHSRCAKMKIVTSTLAKSIVCRECVKTIKGIVEPDNKISFYDQVELVKSFCNLGDRVNAIGASEAAVTTRTRNE